MRSPHPPSAAVLAAHLAGDACCGLVALVGAARMTQPAADWGMLTTYAGLHATYLAVFLCAWPFAANACGLFNSQRREELGRVARDVAAAMAITIVVVGFVIAFLTPMGVERAFLWWFAGYGLVALAVWRMALQFVLRQVRARGYNTRRVLVVGANLRVKHLVHVLENNPQFGYQLVGVLEDEPERCQMLEGMELPYLGKFDQLERVLANDVVDEVYIGLPVRSRYETIQRLTYLCEGVGVNVRLIADLFPLRLATSRFVRVDDVPVLSLSSVPENVAQIVLQRATDIFGSLTALLLFSPVLMLTALAIRIDSPGPIFFLQERVGQNQRRFKMVKFRSMVRDAEARRGNLDADNEVDGPVFKMRHDPRITRVGRFIRRYSIDELPQLFNVLKGDMSLVGPRPPLPAEVSQYAWAQRRRLSIKPGMTGLSQVRGRSDLSFRETVDLDLEYIDRWSLLLVFRILLATIPAVLRGRGAM